METKPQYTYKALIMEVYDGDTLTAKVDLGFKINFTEKIRLLGINAPELKGSEKNKGLKSRDALRNLILNKEVIIQTEKDKKEKYGRYLGTIYIEKNGKWICVNDWLVEQKLAAKKKY
ncbi:MAG: thermonuclease family protein [Bacteroidota bacterium]